MTRKLHLLIATAALAAAVVMPASAQDRLSLSERVARLEAQANPAQGGAVDLVNQINALQSQVQTLQGKVEELQHALDQAQQRNQQQYLDLDSRLGRLEGRAPGAAPAAAQPPKANEALPDVQLGGGGAANAAAAGNDTLTAADRAAGSPAASAPAPADPAAESSSYNEAFSALKDGRYAESARRFQSFIDQYPASDLAANAYYWLGESYYATQNYPIALESFQTLLTRFPQSQKAPDALLKLGYSQYELRQFDAARDTLTQVTQKYPDTTVARLAQGRLRALAVDAAH
ncbi:tol-pal system protein YbgF [Dokdonella sp.]|uniref:tol-pal system protein YbgF n=1 Tax=Dokdonella sp. TaxID=2291710 RepID=UPI0025BDC237|nr:tol-pal system protein YbgF [Dokdonella sp.]MBX3689405.1 tol-pal system protein YbgF [Dokdonella sp.]